MAYSEKLADRIREALSGVKRVKEQPMMGGLTFMVNGKMCVGIIKDDLMCRVGPENMEEALSRPGCHPMKFKGMKPFKGFVLVDDSGMKSKKDFEGWINMSLDFNKKAKASRK